MQPNTNNSALLKQLDTMLIYQTGGNVKALKRFSVTYSMDKQILLMQYLSIILKCTFHWKPAISLLAVDPRETLIHEHKEHREGPCFNTGFNSRMLKAA